MTKNYSFETLAQHAGQVADPTTGARALPIYQTTAYQFKDVQEGEELFALKKAGHIYTRLSNPTQDVLEKRIAALENGTAALAVASGMAATTYTVLNLANFGITTKFVNPDKPEDFAKAITDKTKGIFLETLGNPAINIPDFEAIIKIAHEHGLPVIVDSTFTTPYLCRPFDFGADIVVHSATKFIGGHGTSMGGLIVENGKFDWEGSGRFPDLVAPDRSYHGISFVKDVPGAGFVTRIRAKFLRDLGACISPFNCWLLVQGLETLSIRMERYVSNAQKLAAFLAAQPQVEKVHYPGLPDSPYYALAQKYLPKGAGAVFSIELKNGYEAARRFIDKTEIFSDLANVGDSKSLLVHPASTTHQQLDAAAQAACGIKPGTVRVSVGLENADDLIADVKQALQGL